MLELTVTIALISVVAAIAFVSASQYFRTAYQNEVNETAKQIYIAAQNHLTVADSLGALSDKTTGTPDTTTDEGKAPNSGIYYYVLPADKASLDNKKSMLATMLPSMSIDETVRTSGSYIIRYQYKPGFAASVLDVFYANASQSNFVQGSFVYTFTSSDFATLFGSSTYRGESVDSEEARANYNGAIIGYYGGADVAGSSESLTVPKLEIYNAEVLSARMTNKDDFKSSVRFEFYATGEVSGAVSKPIVPSKDEGKRKDGFGGGKRYFEAVFDSVTQEGCHFADLESSIEGVDFIPGENIKIQVFAIDTASTKVSKSSKRTVNSLFGAVSTTSVSDLLNIFAGRGSRGSNSRTAKIASIRHLENLSYAVSLYNPSALGDEAPASYEQVVDLSWPDFCKMVVGLEPSDPDTPKSLAVQIIPKQGDSSKEHTFLPVNWTTGKLSYNGNARKVTDVEVDATGNAGLFGTVSGSASAASSISDIELVNFKVVASNGNAGTLVGNASHTNITRAFAHDEADIIANGVTVSGTGAAGGLVGNLASGTMTGCAAAVYVTGTNVAGGLVGSASGNATVRYSYSGGHTAEGAYEGDRYASNVSATTTAGGLVGSFVAGTITGCYSTCSVSAATTAGLVGSNGASIGGSYAVGSVNGEAWAATSTEGGTLSTATYDSLVGGGKNAAVFYDETLGTKYGNKYPFKTIAEVSGASSDLDLASATATQLVKHLKAHYGDWPAVVTTVVNS